MSGVTTQRDRRVVPLTAGIEGATAPPVSTSSPSNRHARRWIVILLATLVAICIVSEIATRRIIMPSSRIERRIRDDLREARTITRDDGKSVLIAGNSLILFALDTAEIERTLAPQWHPQRLAIEGTYYLDWWYGFQQLWSAGARPAHIVLMLGPGDLVTHATRGDYAAYSLLRSVDVVPLGREAGMHPTEISRLVLSHYSAYYGFRSESRKVLLDRVVPGMADLVTHITPPRHTQADTVAMADTAERRLAALRDLAAEHGATFTFVVGPLRTPGPEGRAIVRAAHRAGVDVVPAPESVPESWFLDGIHLNKQAATRYTAALAPYLQAHLAALATRTVSR